MGIRSKLVLCLLAVLLPLVAVGTFATHLFDLQLAERSTAALANTQRLEAARIEQILEGYANDARSLASGAHVQDYVSRIHLYNREKSASANPVMPLIGGEDGFAIVDPNAEWPLQQLALALQRKAGIIGSSVVELKLISRDGHILGETMGFSWEPADGTIAERSMRKVKTLFGDAFLSLDSRRRLGLTSPIINSVGEVVGALLIESRLGPIINLIAKHEDMGMTIEAHIAQPTPQGDAQFITPLRFDRKAAFNKIVPASRNLPINQSLNSPQSKVIKALDYRGVESFLAFQTIENTGWGLVVKIDTAETFAPAAKLRNWLLWATAASIGFVALINLFFLIPVVQRLKRAAAAARQILDGNLSTRLVDESNDEIAELSTSINCLARDLEADKKIRFEVEAKLRHQALHDELTGLLNRKHANLVIRQLTEQLDNEHSVMFLDLNGFKDVNDLYGHAAGDDVLKCIAQRLSEQVPEESTLARWGGDEFVIILPNTTEQQATDFALVVHSAFDEPVNSSEGRHNISCSIGLATSSEHKPLDQALLEADELMYEQKKQHHFHRSKGNITTRGVERALMEDRMEMWFQPKVRLQRPGMYTLAGAETSLRIRNSLGGYVLPAEFMPELVDSKAAKGLDDRTLELSLSALRRWTISGIVDSQFRLSIRMSKQTLDDAAFPFLLEDRLRTLDIQPTQIQLELPNESSKLSDTVLLKLRELGVPLALNAQDCEHYLPRSVASTKPSTAIVGTAFLDNSQLLSDLITTCTELKIDITADDVQSREQLAYWHSLGVTQFQGGLFEQPVRAVDFVSRWGQSRLTGLGRTMMPPASLRLAG